jgi:hypothetical protein
VVKSTGDGALATFDGPGQASRRACAMRDAVRSPGVDMRTGLHTGEIELRGDHARTQKAFRRRGSSTQSLVETAGNKPFQRGAATMAVMIHTVWCA